jgi:tetratricopeptide (TPR) repeat protein
MTPVTAGTSAPPSAASTSATQASPATPGSMATPQSRRRRHALLEILGEFLETAAGSLLIGASVYREPADRNALLFQVGLHDWAAERAPDTRGPTPPYEPPADLSRLTAACVHADLLSVTVTGPAAEQATTVFVDRWIAGELHKFLGATNRRAELADAHRRAAEYWQWRAAAWPQGRRADIHDLLEARQHLFLVDDVGQVNDLTGVICAQLRAWGDLDHETELIQATLDALPSPSADRGRWLLELAAIAQAQGDLATAEARYLRAAKMFVEIGDAVGAAHGYESLGVLAHVQGDYRKAERHYRAAAYHRPNSASPAEQPLRPAERAPTLARPPSRSGQPPFGPAEPPAGLAEAPTGSSGFAAGTAPAVTPPDSRTSSSGAEPALATQSPPAASADLVMARPSRREASAGRPWRMRRPAMLVAGSLALVALTATTAALAHAADHSGAAHSAGGSARGSAAAGSSAAGSSADGRLSSRSSSQRPAAGESLGVAQRAQAAAWVARQVSRSAVVACDPAMCAALHEQGLAAGDLLVIGPGAGPDPLGSDIVVSTAAVRSQFGARLAGVYAPLVIASFGTGSAAIEVRVTAPDGSAAYQRAMDADLRARQTAGTELIGNSQLSIAAPARQALAGGQVDSRLLTTIAALAQGRRLRIVGFGDSGPGADGGAPLRSAEVAVTGPGAGTAALGPLLAFLRAQRPPYLASTIASTQLSTGQPALRFTFSEPSPLGLLTGGGTAP